MPTLPQKLEAIRAVCVRANLERKWNERAMDVNGDWFDIDLPVLLSDVLVAMDRKTRHANGWMELCVLTDGCISDAKDPNYNDNKKAWWNLLRPSLEEQEEPTVNLIYEILCAK